MKRRQPTRRDPRAGLIVQLSRLTSQAAPGVVQLGEHRLPVKHPTKVLWPELGMTTVDLMRYYIEIAPVLLPHTRDRPLSFRRFAQGIHGPSQFHQRIKWPVPAGVRAASFAAKNKQFETRLIAGDLTTLMYCVSLAIISQDVWLSRISQPDTPDYAVFDLDPAPSLPFKRVVDVAWRVRDVLEEYGVPHGIKTSGVSGLHVYVPVVGADYHTTRLFVAQVGAKVAARCPDLATVTRTIRERGPRVYLDPDQNMRAKTMSAPYSARHSSFAGVSAPLTWEELDHGARPEDFTISNLPERVRRIGDLWSSLGRRRLDLGELIKKAV